MVEDALPFENTIHESLGIRALEVTTDKVVLEMEVGPAVHQPFGLLHGGASAVMAESAASLGTFMNCIPGKQVAVGTDLNISHLRARTEGKVRAIGVPIRKGRHVHVWGISIVDQDDVDIAVARCTVMIKDVGEAQG